MHSRRPVQLREIRRTRQPEAADEPACKPGSVARRLAPATGGHPSRAAVADNLSGLPGSSGGPPSNAPCLTLLRVGFAEPPGSPRALVVSYTTVSPLPPAASAAAVCSLWHCPAGHPGWALPTTLPCGARTFLGEHPKVRSTRPPGRLVRRAPRLAVLRPAGEPHRPLADVGLDQSRTRDRLPERQAGPRTCPHGRLAQLHGPTALWSTSTTTASNSCRLSRAARRPRPASTHSRSSVAGPPVARPSPPAAAAEPARTQSGTSSGAQGHAHLSA